MFRTKYLHTCEEKGVPSVAKEAEVITVVLGDESRRKKS